MIIHFQVLKVKDLKLIIDNYNELVPNRKKILIYDIYKLDKNKIYFLFFIMYYHENLANFQPYFEDNALLYLTEYDVLQEQYPVDYNYQ